MSDDERRAKEQEGLAALDWKPEAHPSQATSCFQAREPSAASASSCPPCSFSGGALHRFARQQDSVAGLRVCQKRRSSPPRAYAPISRVRRAFGLRRTRPFFICGCLRPWLQPVRPPGSVRTDQVLGIGR
jgi:hypothetical protein